MDKTQARQLRNMYDGLLVELGCADRKNEGFIGIDNRELPGVDIVHDLEVFPWPLEDESVGLLVASHFVEHLHPRKFFPFMDEAWRVLKFGHSFLISCPYANSRSYLGDPTHMTPINELTWSYFDPLDQLTDGNYYKLYRPKPWQIEKMTWNEEALLEVSLAKRKEDPSYGQ